MAQINRSDTFNAWRLAFNALDSEHVALDSDYRNHGLTKTGLSVSNNSGLGSLSYDNLGTITLTPVTAQQIRSLFSVGPGIIAYDSDTGQFTSTAITSATTTTLGIASFNSNDFTVSSGAVSLKSLSIETGDIKDDAVTYAKMQNVATANRLLGSTSAGGVISELQVQTAMVADDAITYGKIQNVVTANRLLGSTSAGGIVSEVQVQTAMVADDAVTYAKMQNVATANRLLGSTSAGGIISEVQVQTAMVADDAITSAKLSNLVSLVIYNSAGTAVKTLYGAGS